LVPEGWAIERLENLAQVERGKFTARPRNNPSLYGGAIPFVQTGDIRLSGGWLKNYSQTLNEQGLRVSRIFPAGTILITIAANIGDVAIATFPVACPDSIVAIQPSEKVSNIWLMYVLQTHQEDFEGLATQNAQKNINLETLRPFKILIPPLPEQRAIAAILSTWDEAITLTTRLIDALKRRKAALMQLLLTGEVRFSEFDGEWEEIDIGDVAQLTAGGTPSTRIGEYWGGDIRWMSSGEVHQKRVYEVEGRITEIGLNNSSAKMLPINSILVALAGQGKTRGTVAINKVELATNQSIAAIMPDPRQLHYGFLFYNLDARYEELRRLSTGDGGRGGLNLQLLKSIAIAQPSIQEQQCIADALEVCDAEIAHFVRYAELLTRQKRGLMQQLLTGAVRVQVGET